MLIHRVEIAPPSAFRPRRFDFLLRPKIVLGRWARRIRRALAAPLPVGVPHRFPFLAAFLSLAPGLGQLYNHQIKKVPYFLVTFAGFLTLTCLYVTVPYLGNILIFATISVVMASYADALVSAAAINGQYFTLRNKLAALTYPFFLLGFIGFFCAILSFFGWPFFSLFHVRGDYMQPALQKGDAICDEGITYLFRSPRPGDVVRYDPPGYSIEVPGGFTTDKHLVDPQNGWERIMAVGGETLEYRDEKYYIDGKPLSPEYYPLLSGQMYSQFKITCPPDQYIILISAGAVDNSIIIKIQGRARAPSPRNAGVIVIGWAEACCVEEKSILARTWFRSFPGPRRRFFQAKGPRFLENPPAAVKTQGGNGEQVP